MKKLMIGVALAAVFAGCYAQRCGEKSETK